MPREFKEFVENEHGIMVPGYITGEVGKLVMPNTLDVAEIDQSQGERMFTNFGSLQEFSKKHNALPASYAKEQIWTGIISKLKDTTHDPELAKLIEAALDPLNLENYYVNAKITARTRCIDGRLLAGYLLESGLVDPAMVGRDLGPQVPGGTPSAALIYRIINRNWQEKPTLGNDIRLISKIYQAHGIRMGGHIDGHKADHLFDSGCGAIDNMPAILDRITSPYAIGELKGLVRALMGDGFNPDTYDMVEGRMLLLESMRDFYFGKYDIGNGQSEFAFKKDAIQVLNENAEKEHHPVAKLTGDHHEHALVINLVKGTTFDRDRFWADNQGRVQLFNYDLWRSEDFANILYPTNLRKQTPEQNRQHHIEQQPFLTARIMYAVATAMVLTDGSLDLIIRQ